MHQATSSCSVLPMTLFGSGGANTQLRESAWGQTCGATRAPRRDAPRHTHKSLMPFREIRRAIEVWLTAVLSAAAEGLVGPIEPVAVTWACCRGQQTFTRRRGTCWQADGIGLTAWPAIRAAAATRAEANISTVWDAGQRCPTSTTIAPIFIETKTPSSPSVCLGMQSDFGTGMQSD